MKSQEITRFAYVPDPIWCITAQTIQTKYNFARYLSRLLGQKKALVTVIKTVTNVVAEKEGFELEKVVLLRIRLF